jgi:DNA modification methylase
MGQVVRIGRCTLYQGDCTDILPTLNGGAVLTDPPYGIGRAKGFKGGGKGFQGSVRKKILRSYDGEDWDAATPTHEAFQIVLSAAPLHIIWGGQYFAHMLPASAKWLWWDKCQTMPSLSDGEMAWTSLAGASAKKFVYSQNGLHAKEKDRVHPTQKPVQLMKWCIGMLNASPIIDPYMGSGSTLVACQQMGIEAIGIERDAHYFEVACKRVQAAYDEPDMFAQSD